jgi:transposase-like protein
MDAIRLCDVIVGAKQKVPTLSQVETFGYESLVPSVPKPASIRMPTPIRKSWPRPSVAGSLPKYKHRIVFRGRRAKGSGQIGALLRREGLYSSTLAPWRRERENVVRQALTPHKRGPKSKRDPVREEVQKLQKDNARLTEELRQAAIIIDVQKNWARCGVAAADAEEIDKLL